MTAIRQDISKTMKDICSGCLMVATQRCCTGTCVVPADDTVPYTWESVADKEQTGSALLASTDDSKTFTYEDGELTYSASAFGATRKMRLVRTEKDYSY